MIMKVIRNFAQHQKEAVATLPQRVLRLSKSAEIVVPQYTLVLLFSTVTTNNTTIDNKISEDPQHAETNRVTTFQPSAAFIESVYDS